MLPFLGSQSEVLARCVKFCVSKFYGFVNLRVIFNNTCRVKSFFPYKDRLSCSQRSKVVYRANCWDCDSFYVGKTKRRLHDSVIYCDLTGLAKKPRGLHTTWPLQHTFITAIHPGY